MSALSKSKLLAYVQCPRQLWLEVHRPELRAKLDNAEQLKAVGNRVGELARRLYDPEGHGELIDVQADGFGLALARSRDLLAVDHPIFEASFSAGGARFFADILEPIGGHAWKLVEVKSTGSLKDYHLADVAVQAYVADRAGVDLQSIAVAHIDTSWTYLGGGDYRGLLIERDVTERAKAASVQVAGWIEGAQAVLKARASPKVRRGRHCSVPFECGFADYCRSIEPDPPYPATWLPRVTSQAIKTLIEDRGPLDMRDVPDHLLNPVQQRVKVHTLEDRVYFDAEAALLALCPHGLPAYFLDFETIQFAVPIWPETRPFQQIPFQFSLHHLDAEGACNHDGFLDLTGDNPAEALARSLVSMCGEAGVIFAYNAGFERGVMLALAEQLPALAGALRGIAGRLVDLLPVARQHFYNPSQKGSWSIKAVLPAIAPDLRYQDLDGVQHGGMAQEAYLEAIRPETAPDRRAVLQRQLERYCELDTWAMVRLWQFFTGQSGAGGSNQK